jgi:hypothetical protein
MMMMTVVLPEANQTALTLTLLSPRSAAQPWMKQVLLIAAVYNLLWGAFVVLLPSVLFDWCKMPQPNYPQLWQCVGMIVGCYGLGYGIAAFNPLRHWPVLVVGLVGKVLGPIGFIIAVIQGTFSPWFGLNIITNDLVWWVPFFIILKTVYTRWHAEDEALTQAVQGQQQAVLSSALTQHGQPLLALHGLYLL